MKKILTIVSIALFSTSISAQCGVTFSVGPNSNLGVNSVELTLNGTSSHVGYSVGIDWGDGSVMSTGFTDQWVHTYSGPGTYTICVDFLAPTCFQEQFCETYTISEEPIHLELCPLTVNHSLSGNTLTVDATGSGALDPYLEFYGDFWGAFYNPQNPPLPQFITAHTGTFIETYGTTPDQTYFFCVWYGDEDDECEENEYCASVTYGNPPVSLAENTDFLSTIEVYPVPASTFINVHFSELNEFNNVNWKIVSVEGKTIQEGMIKDQTSTILLPVDMAQGNYRLVLSSDKKERVVNFVKQ